MAYGATLVCVTRARTRARQRTHAHNKQHADKKRVHTTHTRAQSLTLGENVEHKKATFAVTVQVLKCEWG
jgi:hypothetical protein